MRRGDFLKIPLSLLLGTKLVIFFRPKKRVELATLMEGADIKFGPGPFHELPNEGEWYTRQGFWHSQYTNDPGQLQYKRHTLYSIANSEKEEYLRQMKVLGT